MSGHLSQAALTAAMPPEVSALTINEVMATTKQSKGQIYELIKQQQFPPPRKAGRKSLWLRHEIDAWLLGLPTS